MLIVYTITLDYYYLLQNLYMLFFKLVIYILYRYINISRYIVIKYYLSYIKVLHYQN